MKRKNAIRQQLTPPELYAVITEAISHYHLKPAEIISQLSQIKPDFSSDKEVVDQFHHVFEQVGDPYSCIVKTDDAGADIDPEDDDDTPDVTFERLEAKLGLVRISKFRHNTCADNFAYALKALSDCRGLIIDLRDNPGGLHLEALDISQMLLAEGNLGGQAMASKDGFKSVDYTLTAKKLVITTSKLDGSNKKTTTKNRRQNLFGNKPIVVLVDENTKSASEVLASVLQENGRAKLIGKRTFGKGRGTNNLSVPNGFELQVLGFYWFTPNGHCIGASAIDPDRGIVPDYDASDELQYMTQALELLTQA
ncbi:MAG: S41 family peptidase [Candidatus Obscuribacterales bacterium]|nr:S41 family peptidase [Candidatus Obscuribacterales bacterium]